VRFLSVAENYRENHVQLLWLQRVLSACSGGQELHLQLAASVPHDFSDLADEFMASY
jgi:hypothetical protein